MCFKTNVKVCDNTAATSPFISLYCYHLCFEAFIKVLQSWFGKYQFLHCVEAVGEVLISTIIPWSRGDHTFVSNVWQQKIKSFVILVHHPISSSFSAIINYENVFMG